MSFRSVIRNRSAEPGGKTLDRQWPKLLAEGDRLEVAGQGLAGHDLAGHDLAGHDLAVRRT